jgi:hypothetical protein
LKLKRNSTEQQNKLYYQVSSAPTLCHDYPQPASIVLFGAFRSTSP